MIIWFVCKRWKNEKLQSFALTCDSTMVGMERGKKQDVDARGAKDRDSRVESEQNGLRKNGFRLPAFFYVGLGR